MYIYSENWTRLKRFLSGYKYSRYGIQNLCVGVCYTKTNTSILLHRFILFSSEPDYKYNVII